jgi:L-glyceraldehyde 3-phosphate reductase
LLSDRYLTGIPADSRAGKAFYSFLKKSDITNDTLVRIRALNDLARERGQTLAQMALAWVLRDTRITSLIIGASKVEQIEQNIAAIENLKFSDDELSRIEFILAARAIAS